MEARLRAEASRGTLRLLAVPRLRWISPPQVLAKKPNAQIRAKWIVKACSAGDARGGPSTLRRVRSGFAQDDSHKFRPHQKLERLSQRAFVLKNAFVTKGSRSLPSALLRKFCP
jgi:hypothetical protein